MPPLKHTDEPIFHRQGRDKRTHARDEQSLIDALQDPDPRVRRWSARDLANHPCAVEALLAQIPHEGEHSVRDALFLSLETLGGDTVMDGMIALLRGDDAELRANAIEVLQTYPDAVAQRMFALLNDDDVDVRIMALDIIRAIAHEKTPEWLMWVLNHESDANVIGTALDRLMEVGDRRALQVLAQLRERLDEPYLCFAIDAVHQRIADTPAGEDDDE